MKIIPALCLILILAGCGKKPAPPPPAADSQPPPADVKNENPPPNTNGPTGPPDLATHFEFYRISPTNRVLEMILSGDKSTAVKERDDLVTPFQIKTFRDGSVNELQLIGQAPECHLDRVGHRAWDDGAIVLFTPTTNVWLQGESFLFVETNHTLFISNKVETRVLRSLLKTAATAGGATNAPGAAQRLLKIFAHQGQFDYEDNVVVYIGAVHVVDEQLDVTSDRLTVHFTNSAVETILAEGNVVLTTTNHGQATAATAFYSVTNGIETMELTGQAAWHYGDEQANADKFIYDSTRHFLTAIGQTHLCWPAAAPTAEERRTGAPPRAGPGGVRQLSADFATVQWPPTNGPIEVMHAKGHVVIDNPDLSKATGAQADYLRTNNLFELTGDPAWRNEQMEITGRVLTAELTNNIYHTRGDSHLKIKVTGTTRSNQWLYFDCANLDYSSNRAVFHDDVQTRLLEGGVLRDSVSSDLLVADLFSNQVRTAVARGHVRGETAPDKLGNFKTITCDNLTVHRDPLSGLTQDVAAEDHVTLQQIGPDPAPYEKLTAVTVTAWFAAVTNHGVVSNQLERAVAEQAVVIDQVKNNQNYHAIGRKVVYTATNDEARLTGDPMARTSEYLITGANVLILNPKTNQFTAIGPFRMSEPDAAHPSPTP